MQRMILRLIHNRLIAKRIKRRMRNPFIPYDHGNLSFNDFSPDVCRHHFRFEREDLPRLRRLLGIPDIVKTKRNGYVFTGDHALLVLLRRMAYPARWNDLVPQLRRSKSELSEVFNHCVLLLCRRFEDKLFWDRTRLNAAKLTEYAEAIHRKGCPEVLNVIGFLDGTFRPCCRPDDAQEAIFSGHYRGHGWKFQAVSTPDGLISHLDGPYPGRVNDQGMVNRSTLLELIKGLQDANDEDVSLYADAGYFMAHEGVPIVVPYCRARLTKEQVSLVL